MKTKKLPPIERLQERFHFDFEKGKVFLKRRLKYSPKKVGEEMGSYNNQGYHCIFFDGIKYQTHRLMYHVYHGDLTENDCIDHIDGNTNNNSISNLRKASKAENSRNRSGVNVNNKLGKLNISEKKQWNGTKTKQNDYFVVKITRNYKSFRKYFNKEKYTIGQVQEYAQQKRQELFGEFT